MAHKHKRTIRRGTALIADVVNFYGQEPRSLEAIADLLDDLYVTSAGVIHQFGGQVVKWLGDGVLACFWDESAPIRAVRAAVALQSNFTDFVARHGFKDSGLTISLATGEMIAGMFGSEDAAHYDVFGEPVTCTATIMPGASGAITLCEATYLAVSDLVDADELTEHEHYGPLYALKALK